MKIAAITVVRDEAVMLPRWIDYYGGQLGTDHLYVIDDNSSDGSTTALPCSVIRVPDWGSAHFERTRMQLVSGIAAGLLAAYDAVLFADADEFLVADPKHFDGLADLIRRVDRPVIGAVALNVMHVAAREPALRPDAPILSQRSVAKFMPLMCKPAVKRVADPWVAGSHGVAVPYELDPRLFLFHMKFADRGHLEAVGNHRKHLATTQGRAAQTSWDSTGEDLTRLLDELTAGLDPADLPEFKPTRKLLDGIVRQMDTGAYRAHGRRQMQAMRHQRPVAIPRRFAACV